MALVDSTVVRNLATTTVLVGGPADVARVAPFFEAAYVRVVSAPSAAAAGERLADVMPQVVVILGKLEANERSDLADRATAVGALVMYIDPQLDAETLEELVNRAVRTAIERRLRAESNEPHEKADPASPRNPDEVDEGW
jgi:hypothetical protein